MPPVPVHTNGLGSVNLAASSTFFTVTGDSSLGANVQITVYTAPMASTTRRIP